MNELLDAWRTCFDPALANRIDGLQALVPLLRLGGSKKELGAQLLALDPTQDRELAQLFAYLPQLERADGVAVLQRVLQRPPDPRWGSYLCGWLDTVPFISGSDRWRAVFAVLEHSADVRSVGRLAEGRGPMNPRAYAAITDRRWNATARALRAIEVRPCSLDLAALDERIAVLALERRDRAEQLRTLEARLVETRDPETALVLGDLLLQQGDARGELMVLQATDENAPRQRELVSELGLSWLGPLAPIATRKLLRFELGLPTRLVTRFKTREQLDAVIDAPQWASIEDLTLTTSVSWPAREVFPLGLLLERHPNLRIVRGITDIFRLQDALFGERDVAVEELHCIDAHWPWKWRIGAPPTGRLRVPRLRHLTIPHRLAPWIRQLLQHGLEVPSIEVRQDRSRDLQKYGRSWPTEQDARRAARSLRDVEQLVVRYGERNRDVLQR